MADPTLTVVIPIRDRAGDRVDNCLRSLAWQDVGAGTMEVVLSDFGSSESFVPQLAELAERHGARVVRSDTTETWNRARALNIGVRAARGRYVFCTDADMIFAPNFVSTLLREQSAAGDGALVVCRCRDLPDSVAEQPRGLDEFETLLGASVYRERLGTGACQMATKAFFERVRGFDEKYVFWGLEDTDMTFRAQRAGLELRWVHEQTAMLHQWHSTTRHERPWRKMLNDVRFHLTKYRTVKNGPGWGRA